ncbi:MAG: TetR/AcrR family transcriptional regulator [Proteobacteria bacterium]|nr:TetR/AcrR family transcriptional regulator [Pseudomonadota bacterium]
MNGTNTTEGRVEPQPADPATLAGAHAKSGSQKRRRDPQDSQRRILQAAEQAFARRGFEGARLRDIAHTAGVHHALVHHYYEDKEGLFRAVLESALQQVSAPAPPRPAPVSDLGDALDMLVDFATNFFSSHRNLTLIMDAAYRDPGSTAHRVVSCAYDQRVRPLFGRFVDRIKSAQQHGLLRDDIDAQQLLVLTLGVVAYRFQSGTAAQVLHEDNFQDPSESKRTLVDFLARALMPQRSGVGSLQARDTQ